MRIEVPASLKIEGAGLLDERDLAVRLEAQGVTDRVAAEDYGYADTIAMAEALLPGVHAPEPVPAAPVPSQAWREYLRGTAYAIPLALCAGCMMLFHFSLWGGDVDAETATAVALGTIGSFIATGGVVQALARNFHFHTGCGEPAMAAVSARRWLKAGVVGLVLSAACGVGLNAVFLWFHPGIMSTALLFHFALGTFWLAAGLLHVVERQWMVAVATLAGLALVPTLHHIVGMELLIAQLSSVAVAAGISLFGGLASLRRASNEERIYRGVPAKMLFLMGPYLAYGTLYYVFLFADRVLAWTASAQSSAAPLIFRGDYELPLDLALAGFVMIVGWVQLSMKRFFELLNANLPKFRGGNSEEFNSAMRSFYVRRAGWFLPCTIPAVLGLWVALRAVGALPGQPAETVALLALLATPPLVLALWNVSLLFSLSVPTAALPSAVCAAAANFAVGYLASRTISYEWAVLGYLLGAWVFATLSTMGVLARFRRLDYLYFAAGA